MNNNKKTDYAHTYEREIKSYSVLIAVLPSVFLMCMCLFVYFKFVATNSLMQ